MTQVLEWMSTYVEESQEGRLKDGSEVPALAFGGSNWS